MSNIKKNILFNHASLGIIKSGYYKGYEIEISEIIPKKYEILIDGKVVLTTDLKSQKQKYKILNIVPSQVIGVLNDSKTINSNIENVFFKDVMILDKDTNQDIYASVKNIFKKGNDDDYYISGEIFKSGYKDIIFRKSDIVQTLNTFKVIDKPLYYTSENGSDEQVYLADEKDETEDDFDFDSSDTESIDIPTTVRSEEKAEISYKDRTSSVQEKLTKEDIQIYKYIEIVFLSIINKGKVDKKMLSKGADVETEIKNMNLVKSINNLLNDIKKVKEFINKSLKDTGKGIVSNSLDELFIISSVVYLHLLSKLNIVDYISNLYDSKYFGKDEKAVKSSVERSLVLKYAYKFECQILFKGLEIKKVLTNIISCFIKISEKHVETKPITIKDKGVLKAKPKKEYYIPENLIKIRGTTRGSRDAESEMSSSSSSVSLKPLVDEIKGDLIKKSKQTFNKNKKILYKFLIDNYERIDETIDELRTNVTNILSQTDMFFSWDYNECKDIQCKEKVIDNYIIKAFKNIEDNLEFSNINQEENLILQKYREMKKIRAMKTGKEEKVPKYKKYDDKSDDTEDDFLNKIKGLRI